MTDEELTAAIAAHRQELADILTGLSPRQWDAPTLCDGWRVREVVAHMTMAFRYSMPRFLFGVLMAGGSFTRMSNRVASADAASMSPAELAAAMRDNVHHAWKPPGGGYAGALTHDVIHGLDITVPLGIDRAIAGESLRTVLDGLVAPSGPNYFGVDLTGIEVSADDLDWTSGSGAARTGSAADLVLGLAGRKRP